MDRDTSSGGDGKRNSHAVLAATATKPSELKIETSIIDLNLTQKTERTKSSIHCLESIAYLKKRKAGQLLAIELERLRVINGRMCRIIDCFLAQGAEELGCNATTIRNAFVEELCTSGRDADGVFLKISHRENVEGSLYINFGCDIIRFRWDGTGGNQHIYLNGEGTFFRARSNAYITVERFQSRQLHLVFNECPDSKPLSRRISEAFFEVEQHRYELELKRSNNWLNRLRRLVGKGIEPPVPPAPIDIQMNLTPLDLGLTYPEHEKLVRSLAVTATALERTIDTFQSVWGLALAADDAVE